MPEYFLLIEWCTESGRLPFDLFSFALVSPLTCGGTAQLENADDVTDMEMKVATLFVESEDGETENDVLG